MSWSKIILLFLELSVTCCLFSHACHTTSQLLSHVVNHCFWSCSCCKCPNHSSQGPLLVGLTALPAVGRGVLLLLRTWFPCTAEFLFVHTTLCSATNNELSAIAVYIFSYSTLSSLRLPSAIIILRLTLSSAFAFRALVLTSCDLV